MIRPDGKMPCMTTEEIKKRLLSLQEEINALAAQLPKEVDISYGTLYHTRPSDVDKRKKLVLAFRDPPQSMA